MRPPIQDPILGARRASPPSPANAWPSYYKASQNVVTKSRARVACVHCGIAEYEKLISLGGSAMRARVFHERVVVARHDRREIAMRDPLGTREFGDVVGDRAQGQVD